MTEKCFMNVFRIFDGKIPEYQCSPVSHTWGTVESDFTMPESLGVQLLFIFAVGILGTTVIELLNNKLDWFLDPLTNRIEKRYHFIRERNRLNSMNGHP